MNPVLNRLVHALVTLSCDFHVRFHDAAWTTEQAAGFGAGDLAGNTKCLALRDKDGARVVATVCGSSRLDLEAVRAAHHLRRPRMASAAELGAQFGVEKGGVPPVGYAEGVVALVDEAVLRQERVLISPGINNATLEISGKDFARLAEHFGATVATIGRVAG
ncbi:YbaK/EbsC family protein [Streptomyces sp. NPDC059853]|uniref:YbaK/EbsC family protein n=1 Tax=Streptomyces sp. NPDC059853 TaxID=3346973 RepID=UPI0036498511